MEQTPTPKDISRRVKTVDGETWTFLTITLRCSKTMTESSIIELLPNKYDKAYCPVAAWDKWLPYLQGEMSCPIFTLMSSNEQTFITSRDVNNLLCVCLPSIDWQKVKIGTHSLRR